jgi:hypothetical protein
MIYKNNLKTLWRGILTILFIILSILNFIRIDSNSHSASDTLRPFLLQTVILLVALFLIYKLITKEFKQG